MQKVLMVAAGLAAAMAAFYFGKGWWQLGFIALFILAGWTLPDGVKQIAFTILIITTYLLWNHPPETWGVGLSSSSPGIVDGATSWVKKRFSTVEGRATEACESQRKLAWWEFSLWVSEKDLESRYQTCLYGKNGAPGQFKLQELAGCAGDLTTLWNCEGYSRVSCPGSMVLVSTSTKKPNVLCKQNSGGAWECNKKFNTFDGDICRPHMD